MSTPAETRTRTVKVPAVQYRECTIDVAERADGTEGEDRSYPVVFSSEAPVRRWDWDGEYEEVLSHDPADIDLSRVDANGGSLPLLQSHQRLIQLGAVSNIEIDVKGKRGRGLGHFDLSADNPDARRQESLVRKGYLKTTSFGYRVTGMTLVSTDKKTGLRTYRCAWMPMEVSTEPIPADYKKVGIGRGDALTQVRADFQKRAEAGEEFIEFTVEDTITEGERTMPPEAVPTPAQGTVTPAPPVSPAAPASTRDHAAEAAEIMDIAHKEGFSQWASNWVRQGLTPAQARENVDLLKKQRTSGPAQPGAEFVDNLSARDRSRYCYRRAVHMQIEMMEGKRGNYDGLEGEVHQERSRTRAAEHGGILIPWRLRTEEELFQARTLGTTQAAGGSTLVGQQVMPDMIDYLRNKALVLLAGARLYPGLQGNVYFNKKTGVPTVSWMQENPPAGATASEPQYGYVMMSPKTLIGQVQIPRQLLVQSNIDVEADVRNDLGIGHGLALDLAALHGKAADKQPVGIYSAAGVLSHAVGGVPDLTDLTTMPSLMADKNAYLGSISWMTTPLMAGVLMRTQVVSGQAVMLWEGDFIEGRILRAFMARATCQMSKVLGAGANEHGLVVANWNDFAVGLWGNELEIVVDIVTKAGFGQVLITSYSMADTAILRPESFVKGTGATIA